MKKFLVLTLMVLMVLGLMGGVVGSSQWDMWQGDLFNTNPDVDDEYLDAGGRAILNYDKEQGSYMVNVQAYGLKAGEAYNVIIQTGTYGSSDHRNTLGDFVTKENGRGNLYLTGVCPDDLQLDGVSPRVIIWEELGSWVLSTSDADNDNLQPVGSNRGE